MPTGTVKWFNNAKGFGFILPEEGSEDIFAHYSMIEMDGYRTLKAGQAVEFEISQGDKGLHAINIRHAASTAEPQALDGSCDTYCSEAPDPEQITSGNINIPEAEDA